MNRSLILASIFLFSFEILFFAQDPPFTFGSTVVKTPDHGSYAAKTLGPVCRSAPLDIFGGWSLNGVEATGFFHVREVDGTWYLVDPLGSLFISNGITSVERGGGITLPDALKEFSINNLGNWSDVTIQNIPVSPRFNFLAGFKNTSSTRKDLFDRNIFPVFDPGFEAYCDTEAAKFVAPYKDNPWVLGFYTDNELVFHKISLDDYLGLSETDPNYMAANQWMIGAKGEGYTVTESDRMAFRGYVAETYASAVNRGLKKHDPNHLNIGCRLHAAAKYDPYILKGIGNHVDVNSINFYARWEPATEDMDLWLREAGKPFLITEFYTKAEDTGLPNTDGAGWKVYTQQDRAHHFENFTMKLLSHQGSVGWTWFRYIDKNDSNKGILSLDFKWYTTLLESMENVGRDIYNLRRFLLGQETDLTGDTLCSDTSVVVPMTYNVTIEVTDEMSNPVENAAVTLSGYGTIMSDPEGKVTFNNVLPAENTLYNVSKEGFKDTLNLLGMFSSDLFLTLVLEREANSSIFSSADQDLVRLFPVPAKDYVIFNLEGGMGELSVYHIQGSLFYRGKILSGNTRIGVSSWNEGLYIFRIDNPAGDTGFSGKFNIVR